MSGKRESAVRTSISDGTATVVASGDVGADAAARLSSALHAVLGHAELRRVELDMGQVTFIDSYGLRLLITSHRVMADRGGAFVVRGPGTAVRRLLRMTGLDRMISIEEAPPAGGPR